MKILAIAQLEDRTSPDQQILKQTVQPDRVIWHEDKNPAEGINARRIRIAENHKLLQDIVKAYQPDLVWQLEGDSLLPDNCLEVLIENYKELKHPTFGYISGVQVGRHGIYALGAWHVSENEFSSVDYRLKGIQEVDATGFYCLLSPAYVWLKGVAHWTDEPYGPDVNWALSLKSQGFRNYANMDLQIGHKTKRGEIWPTHASTSNVRFVKTDSGWKYRTS